jgi:uroporphyrinogen decarboxylase
MNSRERVLTTLHHREPDRVPFDLGSTVVTGIHVDVYRKLRQHLGLPETEPRFANFSEQVVEVDDDVAEALGIDLRSAASVSMFVHGLNLTDMGEYIAYYDEYGIGWRMPKNGGLYYDMFHHPLAGERTVKDVEAFPWPNPKAPERFHGLLENARKIAEREGRATVVATLTPGICEMASFLRGFPDYFSDLASNESMVCAILDKVVELKIAYWEEALRILGGWIDVAMENDDFAGQDRLFMSPATYRRVVKPRHKAVNDFIHGHSGAKIFLHSCGSVRAVIPDLIEEGFDILNPVQVSARGMDTNDLKREFGKDLVFWGGGVDTQRVLPNGSVEDVRTEVRKRLDDLMPGGGFVFSAVHNIQSDVPPENIMAMWETLREYGVY